MSVRIQGEGADIKERMEEKTKHFNSNEREDMKAKARDASGRTSHPDGGRIEATEHRTHRKRR
jgi:uncharacterized protein with LGFP repeats